MWIVIAGAVLWIASFAGLLIASPSGTAISSDTAAQPVPYWVALMPVAVGIVLTILLPHPSPSRPVTIGSRRPFRVTTIGLVVLAVLFPVLTVAVPLVGESYILGKLTLFMIAPAILLLTVRKSVSITWLKDASRWWAPAVIVVARTGSHPHRGDRDRHHRGSR
jgi:hypothetical protein